jgi:catechol 2,3-dioxygenase-like lactoylglutathione lyase family enzyme
MFTTIRHVAIYTDNYDRMAKFYQTTFGMKKITTGMTDEKGEYNPARGHISDGVIGLALLQRQAGISAGLDHFGFEVDDVQRVLGKLESKYPKVMVGKSPGHVPFAGLRTHDPEGNLFDLSQKGMANVREGYVEKGWDQSRYLNHIAIRAPEPERLAEFYHEVFELAPVEGLSDQENFYLSDGRVQLVVRAWNPTTYRGMRAGLDHIGFKVENLEEAKKDIDELARSHPESAPRKIDIGRDGARKLEILAACKLGKHPTADPDGVLVDLCP